MDIREAVRVAVGVECDGCECREFRDVNDYAFGRRPVTKSPIHTEIVTEHIQRLRAAENRVAQLEEERRLIAREQWRRQAEAEMVRVNPIRVLTTDRSDGYWGPLDLQEMPVPGTPVRQSVPPPVLPDLAIPPKRWVKRRSL